MPPKCLSREIGWIVVSVAVVVWGLAAPAAGKLAFIGSAPSVRELDREALAAFEFAARDTAVEYVPLRRVVDGAIELDEFDVMWWHTRTDRSLPAVASDPGLHAAVVRWIDEGGGLLLSGFAPQFASALGLTAAPSAVIADPTIGGNWGISQKVDHPIFNGLPGTFMMMSDGYPVSNGICWWDNPRRFSGVWLGDVERNGGIMAVGEISRGKGRVIVVGVGAFEWDDNGAINLNRSRLERFTRNTLSYLRDGTIGTTSAPPEPVVELEGHVRRVWLAVPEPGRLDAEHEAIADWLSGEVEYREIAESNLASLAGAAYPDDVIWWHGITLDTDRAFANPATARVLQQFLAGGGGLLLSGFAATHVADLGLEYAPATTRLLEPKQSDEWGYSIRVANHPVFAGLGTSFATLSAGSVVDNRICWWDAPQLCRGVWLADAESGINKLAMAEYRLDSGRVVVTGTGAFEWHTPEPNDNRGNLEQLTRNVLAYLNTPVDVDVNGTIHEVAELDVLYAFDGPGDAIVDSHGSMNGRLASYLHSPRFAGGVSGQALDFDGYSTHVVGPASGYPGTAESFSASAWIAPREFPTEFGAVVNQHTPDAGFKLGITPFGRLWASARVGSRWMDVFSDAPVELGVWSHVAMSVRRGGSLQLFINGEQVAVEAVTDAPIRLAATEPLLLGRDSRTGVIAGIFPTGMFNGLMDDVRVQTKPFDASTVSTAVGAQQRPDLSIGDRFAGDRHRPTYHAMPTHAWTNEPHGLVRFDGQHHLTYQANPAGPYWHAIRWGHLVSDDLVHWEQRPIVMRSDEESYDRVGVWSGCAVVHDGVMFNYYTAVDGSQASIALATTSNGRDFEKHPDNPLIAGRPEGPFQDYRDPFVWESHGEWHMLIGGGIAEGGGTVHHYTSDDLIEWAYRGEPWSGDRATSGGFWEMPVMLQFGDRWLLNVSEVPGRNSYWVGTWDGRSFVPEKSEPTRLELINHFLSPTVTKDEDGSYVAIGIVPEARSSADQLKAGWAHTYGLPRRWTLDEQGRLHQSPHPNLKNLRGAPVKISPGELAVGSVVDLVDQGGLACEIELELTTAPGTVVHLDVLASPDGRERTRISYSVDDQTVVLDRSTASLSVSLPPELAIQGGRLSMPEHGRVRLRVFVDGSIVECFFNDREALSTRVYPTLPDAEAVRLSVDGNAMRIDKAVVWPMDAAPVVAASMEAE